MRPGDLVAYVSRDRSGLQRLNAEHWGKRKRQLGLLEGLRSVDMLRRHILDIRPDWPSAEEREFDLVTHIRVSAGLRRVRRPTR